MTKQETYADKIAKLLRKAESTSPEEAELLYAKAQELMTKYAIDEAMLNAAKGTAREKEPIVAQEFVCTGIYRFPLGTLTHQILINNGLQDILLSDAGWRTIGDRTYKQTYVLMAVGYQSDMDAAKLLEASLHLQAMRAESAWWRNNSTLYSKKDAHKARRGFLFAFAEGAGFKLREATVRGKAAAEEEHGRDSVALVLRSKELNVKDAFTQRYPHTVASKSRRDKGDAWARQHGREAGLNADVGQPNLTNQKELA